MTVSIPARHHVDDATVEQLLRWKVQEWDPAGHHRDHGLDAQPQLIGNLVSAARAGTRDEFSAALTDLVRHYGTWNDAQFMREALRGSQSTLKVALERSPDLQALHRTAARRAEGVDVAEVATANGLRLRAEHTGETYETAILVEDTPGRRDVLANGTVTAASAAAALRIAIEREHALGGLDHADVALLDQQLTRLEQLTKQRPTRPGQGADPLQERWVAAVQQTIGRDLSTDPGWTTLTATLDRAADARWDVRALLADAAPAGRLRSDAPAAGPLRSAGSAGHELAYRVMDACPDAVPPPPSAAHINGTAVESSGRQREAAEHAISRPSPGRAPTVSR